MKLDKAEEIVCKYARYFGEGDYRLIWNGRIFKSDDTAKLVRKLMKIR